MIVVEQVSKTFGRTTVLKDISFVLRQGENWALVGPNGAGKSTLLKILLSLVIPSRGRIEIEGMPATNPHARKALSYAPQIPRFPENMTVREVLHLVARVRQQETHMEELLSYFDLEEALPQKTSALSGGMRQKLNLILALMFPQARFLILDEPTVGLDPRSRIKLKKFLLQQKKLGKTLLFSTHLLGEAEELCDGLLFLLEGRLHWQGPIDQLKSHYHTARLEEAIAHLQTPC
ncbi:MAG: ABC transporter ATP-binding protein [Bacteroidia bacterium]